MKRRTTHRQFTAPSSRRVGLGSALLLAWLLALGLLTLTGCKELEMILARRVAGSSHGLSVTVPAQPAVVGMKADRKVAAPGSWGSRRLFKRSALPYGGRLEWWPPLGARDFSFPPGHEPLPGGPPFVWNDIPFGEERVVRFRYSSGGEWGAVDTFSAYDGSGWSIDRVMNITEGLQPGARTASIPGLTGTVDRATAFTAALDSRADTVDAWKTLRTFLPQDSTLTTERCQQLVDWVQGDDVFFALRLPISPTAYLTQAHRVSIYPGDPYSNTLKLLRTVPSPSTPVVTLSLSLRQDYLDFAARALPAAAGEEWVTLGAGGLPADCPAGLDLAPGTWAAVSSLLIDLSHQPGGCAGCVLPGYFCYEGQDPPLAAALLESPGVTSYQGWGITCVGPEITDLGDTTSWVMSGSSMQIVTPTQVISLPHFFYVPDALGSLAFSLSMTSTLDAGWDFYHGDWNGPDLESPITQPFVASDVTYFWLASAPVSTTTADGPYSVVVSATAVLTPSDTRWASDLVWVGDWVAPPPPPPARYRIYLPLMVR